MLEKILDSQNFILRFVINFGDCDVDIDDDKYMRPKADDSHPSLAQLEQINAGNPF